MKIHTFAYYVRVHKEIEKEQDIMQKARISRIYQI